MKVHVRKNDTVVVISSKDKGKTGEALGAIPKTGKVVAKGANLVKKHQKPNGQNIQGGVVEMEATINNPKATLFCEKCKKVTRVSHKLLEDGTKVRVCKKCGETFQDSEGGILRE